ncbi:MAG: acyltransferase [Oscillospiraceae bacterium]|nr:acyltransferase [Oscillospiraceae bacterium]
MPCFEMKAGEKRYQEISFLRGFSITTVILMHLIQVYVLNGEIPGWLRTLSSLGGTGGHMFVFCSGFGLYLSWLRRPVTFPVFLKKRFVKIYLPYIIIVVLSWLSVWYWSGACMWRPLLSHVLLYKMFFEKYEISFGLHLWFLSTIIQLYLLFVPLCRLRERTGLWKLVTLSVLLSMLWWIFTTATGLSAKRIWGSFCLQYLWEFVLGMATAEYLSEKNLRIPLTVLLPTTAAGLGLQALMSRLGGWAAAFNDLPGFFGYASLVILLYMYGERILRPLFLWVDTLSYEWFLVHVLIFSNFYGVMRAFIGNELLLAVGAVSVSLLAAWAFAWILKKLRLKQ